MFGPLRLETEARLAKRRAAEVASATDGLPGRCKNGLGLSLTRIRSDVAGTCVRPGTASARPGCLERVRGVANTYKHKNLRDPNLPIVSDADILVWSVSAMGSMATGLESSGVLKCWFATRLRRHGNSWAIRLSPSLRGSAAWAPMARFCLRAPIMSVAKWCIPDSEG
jgi:hypothetical protein